MNNSVFQLGDELVVEKGREGMVNGSYWQDTGRYWARGTNYKSRTSSTRGTHKVFKSRAKEIRKSQLKEQKPKLKAEINTIQGQLAAAGFIQNPSERLRIRNSNGSISYATRLRTGLTQNQLESLERKYKEENALDAELAGLMGDMGVGGRRSTKRNQIQRRKTRRSHRKTRRSYRK
jgi:hypothetical protein